MSKGIVVCEENWAGEKCIGAVLGALLANAGDTRVWRSIKCLRDCMAGICHMQNCHL